MTKNYIKNYQVLGIAPDARWEDLRNAYKNLVKNWHPDRFQQNADQKKIAEERTKEINTSYKELAEYYKKHGALPVHIEPETTPEQETTHQESQTPPRQHEADARHHTSTSHVRTSSIAKSARPSRTMVIVILVGTGFAMWYLMPGNQPEKLSHQNLAVEPQVLETEAEITASVTKENNFTYGSSIGEVITIQGVPTRTVNNVWLYGDSKIYFEKGKVVRWEESANNPLKAQILEKSPSTKGHFFAIGSSKADVLAIQGAPDRDAGNVWDYGASRIYFGGDRVTRWDESPFNPLKIHR